MFLTKEKLLRRVNELGSRRYFGNKNIAPFISMEGQLSSDEHYTNVPDEIRGEEFEVNDVFVGRDRYLWLDKTIRILEYKEDCEVVGLFDFGETGHGGNHGFESLLYVDGKPFQGVDTNHREVLFRGLEGREVKLTFLLWTGLEGGGAHRNFYHRCQQADLAYLHKKTDELYYFGHAILGSLELMGEDAEYYESLLAALDRAMLCIDWDNEEFYHSIEHAHRVLMSEMDAMEKHTNITVHAIGHTHIDIAWLWRLKHTREKAQRSFSTVLRLMELYDEYVFLQTQPQLYKYIKEDCPEMYERIKEKVAEGKWEIDGGMWVEADCNLSSGEALVRQFLHGTRYIEAEFGKKCEYLWLPDVFGYSWALPQILKQCEINTFMTTKISWNQYNTIPNDLFKWRGIDGTEILTYFIDTPVPGKSVKERYSTYNGLMTPYAVIGNWKKFKNKQLSKNTLLAYGYGDGGGGVNREMLEMRRAMAKLPGLPKVKNSKASDFFKLIHSDVENTDRYVHTWDGELYLEYHRGTYTTQCFNKKMNRHLENTLTQVEWLSSMAYVLGGEYAKQELHEAWESVLLHQFHDIIPGSSVAEVYADSRLNYSKVEEKLVDAKHTAFQTLLNRQKHVYSIYSTNSFGGHEIVFIPEVDEGYFVDDEGETLMAQRIKDGYEVLVNVIPFAVINITFYEKVRDNHILKSDVFKFQKGVLHTPYYEIAWNNNGQLTRIYDKESCREVLRTGQEGNVLEIYEDKPLNYDAWDIDIYYSEKMNKVNVIEEPLMVECGTLKAVVRFIYRYNKSRFVQDMIVYANSRRIDFKTHADWQEEHKLLKVAFYTDIRSTKAIYDIQFGHVERPTHWNNSWDWARFEVCGHKWADLSEHGYGVSLLNDCKYGYSIKDNAMKLSLLRAPKYPDVHADMGEHDFTYSLYPHTDTVVNGGTIEAANQLNLPAQVVNAAFVDTRKLIIGLESSIQIDAVKKAEDEECLVVRMHECRGGRCATTFASEYPIKKIVSCNLLEHTTGEVTLGSSIKLVFQPFEIKTLKLYL